MYHIGGYSYTVYQKRKKSISHTVGVSIPKKHTHTLHIS